MVSRVLLHTRIFLLLDVLESLLYFFVRYYGVTHLWKKKILQQYYYNGTKGLLRIWRVYAAMVRYMYDDQIKPWVYRLLGAS
jgi:hypothetical protein